MDTTTIMTSTAKAHTNIAFIKYWGKKNQQLNLPTTSSLSLTLDKFYTKTTVTLDDTLSTDALYLNNQKVDATRVHQFLDVLRDELGYFPTLKINSYNHVPTSAGLASSASAFAALTGAVIQELGLHLDTCTLSRLARRGSGSASRSFFGHFAVWHAGVDNDSSFAESLHAPAMPIALVVAEVSSQQKKVGSTEGMQRALTSPDYGNWVNNSQQQFIDMQSAVMAADIEKIGTIAEANAMSMHDLNLTATQHPFTYFTAETQRILQIVDDLKHQGLLAFATMDAGPNVKIITHVEHAQLIIETLNNALPNLKLEIAQSGPDISYE